MATRKQKARRAKTFRHEYGFVMNDEEGNEIEVPGAELRGKKDGDEKPGAKPAAKKSSGAGGRRPGNAPKAPSWNRAVKRGGVWGLGVGLVVTFLFHGPLALGLVYGLMFIPLTYWTDGFAYRRWEKKQGSSPPSRPGKTR
ncbi:MAG TPA: hypothetical protein VH063_10350 [Gaiellaceae bacterium]|jgi:hypothetical protein|nr:hypothetical protein [Gaiellaceae bacterium]